MKESDLISQAGIGSNRRFGALAVFFTALSTILGAILFLRFGWALAQVGFAGVLAIILLGHLVTIPTAMAISEIATNRKVQGGGVYFLLSRSFGLVVGGAIGIALFLSQAISVSFYLMAFAEAFRPVLENLGRESPFYFTDMRLIALPTLLVVLLLMLRGGAESGIRLLVLVIGTLFLALGLFFAGEAPEDIRPVTFVPFVQIDGFTTFFAVFAVVFPAFTGLTAGVGLSGDLKDPQKAIPLGTLTAVLAGLLVYLGVAWKLAVSVRPEVLAVDELVMSRVALWGPIIPIGLAAACFSSALGSILAAPRTLQAIAEDGLFPGSRLNQWFAQLSGKAAEPVNALLCSAAISVVFILTGDINFVASVISMFFMLTYGAVCLVSFLEHVSSDPSFRPTFRTPWYVSLFGALICFALMFLMSVKYAAMSMALMLGIYLIVALLNREKREMALVIRGVLFQIVRRLRMLIQRQSDHHRIKSWRPGFVAISDSSMQRRSTMDLLSWISHSYGFGTYIHFIEGYFAKNTHQRAVGLKKQLRERSPKVSKNIFIDTMVSPSFTSAISQIVQLPGISGGENNAMLFEFTLGEPASLRRVLANYQIVKAAEFDLCILGSRKSEFSSFREIHIWVREGDYDNALFMILLTYLMAGHPVWSRVAISVYVVAAEGRENEAREELSSRIRSGRLPISALNVQVIIEKDGMMLQALVNGISANASLVMLGMKGESVAREDLAFFSGFDAIDHVLFVDSVESRIRTLE